MEKDNQLDYINKAIILKRLESKNCLCPICCKRFKKGLNLYIFSNNDIPLNLYYIVCEKCETQYIKHKNNNEKLSKIKKIIKERFLSDLSPYSCEIIDNPDIDNSLNNIEQEKKEIKLNALKETSGIWHINDQEFFENNPTRKFFARPIYDGELEVTNKDDEYLRSDAINKNIKFAIIHRLGSTQRVYSFVSDLQGHPYDEEAFVAALYMVKVNKAFSSCDIYELYEEIKKNALIIDEFSLK